MDNRYPEMPGFKGAGMTACTSIAAAAEIAPIASKLRMVALRTIASLGNATPLEAIAAAKMERESLQPRFSELLALGLIETTGERRFNPSGKRAAVLRLSAKGREALS